MRAVRGALALAFLALAAVALPAHAESVPLEGTMETTGLARLAGANGLRAEVDALLLEDGNGAASSGPQSFTLSGRGLEVAYVNLPTATLLTSGAQATELRSLPEQVIERRTVDRLRFDGDSDNDTHARILAEGRPFALSLAESPAVAASSGAALPPVQTDGAFAFRSEVDGRPTRPADNGGWLGGVTLPGVALDAPLVAFVMGGVADAGPHGPTWQTGRRLNESATHVDPATGSGVVVHDNLVLVVSGPSADLEWPDGSAGWTLASRRLEGTFAGDASWTGVAADLRAGGQALDVDPRLLHVKGDLDLAATLGPTTRWTVSGEADFVAVDAGPDLAAAYAAAAGLAALAGAGALATPWGRILLAFILGRHGRRVEAAPLRSATRRRILDAVHAQQPVRITELQRTTGLARTTLSYHLRVLVACDVLQEQDSGSEARNRTFMLNSGSLKFAVAQPQPSGPAALAAPPASAVPDEATLASRALATANSHPTRREIYEAVRDHGPLDFAGLSALRAAGGRPPLPQSSATHHLQALVAGGALLAWRDGRRKLYAAALDDAAARAEQYRRFLSQMKALDLVRGLAREPIPQEAAGGRRRDLERLRELGIVEVDGSRRYGLAKALRPLAGAL